MGESGSFRAHSDLQIKCFQKRCQIKQQSQKRSAKKEAEVCLFSNIFFLDNMYNTSNHMMYIYIYNIIYVHIYILYETY